MHEGPVSRRFNGGRDSTTEHKPIFSRRDTTRESKPDRHKLRCYNCGKEGHIAMQCPSKALFCGGGRELSTTRTGVVENKKVEDILLDTGCTQIMVRQNLVQEGRLLEGEAVWCAHGDTVLYPLAEVAMEVDGVETRVKAAVSEELPVSVLLGTDTPCLKELLQRTSQVVHTKDIMEAFVVTTRAKAHQERERVQRQKEEKLTRSQKNNRPAHGLVRAMDQPTQVKAVPVSRQKLQELQWSDESLQEPRA